MNAKFGQLIYTLISESELLTNTIPLNFSMQFSHANAIIKMNVTITVFFMSVCLPQAKESLLNLLLIEQPYDLIAHFFKLVPAYSTYLVQND
jgi:hypothetical protein